MPSTAGKKNGQGLTRAFAGLLLALLLFLASLWIAAPRLAEWKLRAEFARLGVSVPELRVRSLTPWSLKLEPFCLGTEPDAPTLGALCVTYSPRELLRGKVRTVTLDGARLVLRKVKSGGWEMVGLDKFLSKRTDSATPAKPLTPKELLALLPDNVSVRGVSVIAATANGRMEFPAELSAVRYGNVVDVRITAEGFGGKLCVVGTVLELPSRLRGWGDGPDTVAYHGKIQLFPPQKMERGGMCVVVPEKLGGTLALQWDPRTDSIKVSANLPTGMLELYGNGWRGRIKNADLDGGFTVEKNGVGYSLDVELRGLSASLTNGTGLEVEKIECSLHGAVNEGFKVECSLRNADLRIPQAETELDGLEARMAVSWSEKGGWQSTIYEQRCSPDQARALKIHGIDFGKIPLRIKEEGAPLFVEAVVTPPGSALSATVVLSANLDTQEVAVSATLPSAAVSEKDPLLAPFLPPSLNGATFSGTVGGKLDATWKPGGEPKLTAKLTLAEGRFATGDGTFNVVGVECGLTLESLVPLRSLPAQKLKFTLAHAAGTPLNDGKFAFRLDPPNTVFIEHGSFGWCGGRLTCAAARITDGKPDGMVMLRAEQVDVGQLFGLAKDFGGHAEGWLSGKVPLLFRPDGMRLGDVHLFTDPEKPGLLQLDPMKWPGNQVNTLGADPAVKKKMKLTLNDMNLNLLRLDTLPGNKQEGTRLCLRFAGTPRKDDDLPPVDFTLNLNLEVRQNRLWELLNHALPQK